MNTVSKPNKRSFLFRTLGMLSILVIVIQFIRPKIKDTPAMGDIKAPVEVRAILKRACYDCHSDETQLGWADHIAPIYWQVSRHVNTGRSHLNFSDWGRLSPADQRTKLWEAVNQAELGTMPLPDYILAHPSSKITASDLQVLKGYLATLTDKKPTDSTKIKAEAKQFMAWQTTYTPANDLPVALNCIPYDSDYKNWEPMSTTERFDTKTMRVIFGNAIAVKAVKENNIRPWPDGTKFAKAAWTQIEDKDGNVRTGVFLQVAFMIKNARKYASTGGWGFATFQTPKMVPYGKTALFANECIACHRPLKNADYVFTLPIKH